MNQRRSDPAFTLISAVAGVWTSFVNLLLVLTTIDTRSYRPEKYYMRGPGPKWRKKHAHDGNDTGSFLR